jgi:hypothetical protein
MLAFAMCAVILLPYSNNADTGVLADYVVLFLLL